MAYYPPLPKHTSIRLLILHSGEAGDELKASFVLDDVDDPTYEYEALSYHWGPPFFPHRIQIDGSDYKITRTLYDALIRLRLPQTNRIIWADAVSINQSSDREKSHQVRLMSRIYRHCTRCVIYLGPEADGSELMQDFFGYLLDWFHQRLTLVDPGFDIGILFFSLHSQYGLPSHEDCRWTAMKAFFRRPWFTRLWILQEFAIPKDLVTICGHWELDGILVPSIAYIFTRTIPLGILLDDDSKDKSEKVADALVALVYQLSVRLALGHPWNLRNSDQFTQNAGPKLRWTGRLRMYSLLHSTTTCNVTDPRDTFLGLLALANDLDDDPGLLPDYSKTLSEIRAAFYAFFLRKGFGYRILSEASLCSSSDLSQPSWMNTRPTSLESFGHAAQPKILTGVCLKRCNSAVSQISSDEVAVVGFLVDQVRRQTVSCCEPGFKILDEILAILNDGLDPDLESYNQIPSSDFKGRAAPTHESNARKALRILCLDSSHKGEMPAPTAFLDLCEVYVNFHTGARTFDELLADSPSKTIDEALQECGDTVHGLLRSRDARFSSTIAGYYGMFPAVTMTGDLIFMIDGAAKTFLVRHQPETNTYLWVGQAWLDNFDEQAIKTTSSKTPTRIVVR